MVQGVDVWCTLRGKKYWTTITLCESSDCPFRSICGEYIRLDRAIKEQTTTIVEGMTKTLETSDNAAVVKANEIKFDEAVFNNTDKAELFTDNQIKEAEAYLADRGAVTAKGEVVEGATVSKNTSVVPFKSKKQRRKDKRRATQIAREKIEGKPVVKPKVKAKPKKKPRPTHAPQRRGKTIGGRE